MMGLLVRKELRTLLREPMVIAMIVLPAIIYGSMSPFLGSAVKQVEEASKLRGVSIAIAACDKADYFVAKTIAAALKTRGANASAVNTCTPRNLIERYELVVYLEPGFTESIITGKARITIYVRGDVSRLNRMLALPTAAMGYIGEALGGEKKQNVSVRTLIVLNNKVWSLRDINNFFSLATFMSYATLFIVFPAASIGASLIGAEREERTLEVLLSLPISRRDIAVSKSVAAIVVGLLAAASAMLGLVIFARSAKIPVSLKVFDAEMLTLYALALGAEALLATTLALFVGLFSTTTRGAQAAAGIVAFPALIPTFLLITGLPKTSLLVAAPFTAVIYTVLKPFIGSTMPLLAVIVQGVEALLVLALLARILETETAVTGPETLKRWRRKLGRRRSLIARRRPM
ncbi:hypothetical protein PYJP_12390 [Pyrofollis japonicus]|nr:hypothetical protein PYJP_12390 [Pyrofollis japonicus]